MSANERYLRDWDHEDTSSNGDSGGPISLPCTDSTKSEKPRKGNSLDVRLTDYPERIKIDRLPDDPTVAQTRGEFSYKLLGIENRPLEYKNSLRGTNEYAERKYARIKDFERGVLADFDELTTVLLTLTCSPYTDSNERKPLLDQFRDSHESHQSVMRKLNREIDARSAYYWINAPQRSGANHKHIAYYVESDSIQREDFQGVLDLHMKNTPGATEHYHPLAEAVKVAQVDEIHKLNHVSPTEKESGRIPTLNLSSYMGGHLPGVNQILDVRTAPKHIQNHAAAAWSGKITTFGTSNDFSQYVELGEKL